MLSLGKLLNHLRSGANRAAVSDGTGLFPAVLEAYRSLLKDLGTCSQDACPVLGEGLKQALEKIGADLTGPVNQQLISDTEEKVREQLLLWSQRAAADNQRRAQEIKEMLVVMARTAESVGEHDRLCSGQIEEVAGRLKNLANLEDLGQIRASIEESAEILKSSSDKMNADGQAVVEQFETEVTTYQAKLEAAENLSSRDSLTGVRNRTRMQSELERQLGTGRPFCVAMVDIDGFREVNFGNGRLAGDEVLKQFAEELNSASRSNDLIGRWDGDEFMILLDCNLEQARAQASRLHDWVCGNYTVRGNFGPSKVMIEASIGVAEFSEYESLKALVDRAEAELRKQKETARQNWANRAPQPPEDDTPTL